MKFGTDHPANGVKLETRVRQPGDLTPQERGQMFRLMSDHYENVDAHLFERDLAEKEWVIATADSARGILGFTTLTRVTTQVGGKPLVALYSGDTAFAPEIWGSRSWVRVWGRHVTKVVKDLNRGPIPWLLLTATHRTYRFLPTFVHEYYPRPQVETPKDVLECMAALARLKFPQEYDAHSGVVRLARPTPVKRERVELASEGLDDADAHFFTARNPGYLNGDFLACLTLLAPENYTRLGRKLMLEPEA